MSDISEKLIGQYISKEGITEIDHWIAKYPSDQKQSAVMQALMIMQDERGYLTPDSMDAIADYLDMAPIAVYEVASFYSMYQHQPAGEFVMNVCTNISCKLRDSDGLVAHLEKKLGIKMGETTADGRFTLRSVECLAACANAPVIQMNKQYYEDLTPEKVDSLLQQCQESCHD